MRSLVVQFSAGAFLVVALFAALSSRLDGTTNRRGSVEFDVPAGTQISALGLRFSPAGTFTTIPVLVK